MTGIYKIENLVNDKVYIGSSINIYHRWKTHKKELKNNTHINNHFQNAWNKYGEENFKFEIIEECEEDKLTEREQYWIDYYGGNNSFNIYNLKDAINGGHLSEVVKEKISLSNKGKPKPEEHKQKLSYSHKGKVTWNKGLKGCLIHTTETKAILSEKLSGKNHPLYGKHHSEETKEKIRQNHLGIKASIETRQKQGKVHKGTIWIHKDKITKMIQPEDLFLYEGQGFVKGRGENTPDIVNRVKLVQLDLEGNFIREFNSIKDATKYFNKVGSLIGECIRGNRQTAYGYMWKRSIDYYEE